MTVKDGGGRVINSEGKTNEEEVFAQRATWCDYSGWVDEGIWEGVAVLDHPGNFGHPPAWHVRDDGWMCPSHFRGADMTIEPGKHQTSRYRIVVHGPALDLPKIDELFRSWIFTKREEGGRG